VTDREAGTAADPLALVHAAASAFPLRLATLQDPEGLAATRATLTSLLSADFEYRLDPQARELGLGSDLRGADAMLEVWGKWLEIFESYELLDTRRVLIDSGRVFEISRSRGRFPSGIELEQEVGAIYGVSDGRITSLQTFASLELALAEAGLDPDDLPPGLGAR